MRPTHIYRIWFERQLPPQYAHLLENVAVAVGAANITPEAPMSGLAGAEAVIASARIRYDGAFLDQYPGVRVISRTGAGLNNVSLPEATARRVAVCYAPDAPTLSTAEHAISLMLAAAKHLKRCAHDLRQGGKRDFFNEYQGVEVNGRCLGLIGLGRIGARVAQMALALGMTVIGYDPWAPAKRGADLGIQLVPTVEAVLQGADFVSLHVPLTAETANMINAERIGLMKPGAYLINTARGGLVDEAALLAALESGHLHGAGLDVFAEEPPNPASPLLSRDDVIATPHIAGATLASKARLWQAAINQALQVLRGERPPNLANPEVWPLSAEGETEKEMRPAAVG